MIASETLNERRLRFIEHFCHLCIGDIEAVNSTSDLNVGGVYSGFSQPFYIGAVFIEKQV